MTKTIIGKATEEERSSMELIQTKLNCVNQAKETPPKGLSAEEMILYHRACIDSLGEYQWLEKRFWQEVKVKYAFIPDDGKINLDLDTGEFFILSK